MAKHYELGKKGEALALTYLKEKGYQILERNYRYRKAEIDIIAQKGTFISIIEVKTRSSNYLKSPQDAVNAKKIGLLVQAADNYVYKNDLNVEVRFDIVVVLKKKKDFFIQHIEDAFLYFT